MIEMCKMQHNTHRGPDEIHGAQYPELRVGRRERWEEELPLPRRLACPHRPEPHSSWSKPPPKAGCTGCRVPAHTRARDSVGPWRNPFSVGPPSLHECDGLVRDRRGKPPKPYTTPERKLRAQPSRHQLGRPRRCPCSAHERCGIVHRRDELITVELDQVHVALDAGSWSIVRSQLQIRQLPS